MTRKEVAARVASAMNFHPDDFKCKKDGSVEFRRSYFYRHGMSAGAWADMVRAVFPEAVSVEGDDRGAQWPKTSYFVATVRF